MNRALIHVFSQFCLLSFKKRLKKFNAQKLIGVTVSVFDSASRRVLGVVNKKNIYSTENTLDLLAGYIVQLHFLNV